MKFNLMMTILVLTLSSLTHACPEISGNWLCVNVLDANSREEYRITQLPVEGGTSYKFTIRNKSVVYQADGVLYSYDEGDITGSSITKCVGENKIESTEQATLKPFKLYTLLNSKIEKLSNEKLNISYLARAEIQGTGDINESKSTYDCGRID